MVKLHTNFGVITLELFADKAPETVENFKQYVRDGHYDNTIFHRVIPNFMSRIPPAPSSSSTSMTTTF